MERALLGTLPLFAGLSPAQLDELHVALRRRQYRPNEVVYQFGVFGNEFYVIQMGHVRTSCRDERGHTVDLAELGPGDFFGEVGLLDGGPRAETTRAVGELALLSMNRHEFLGFLERCPTAASYLVAAQASRLRDTLDKARAGHWR
jgi:CRP-like cAMP-binding protein